MKKESLDILKDLVKINSSCSISNKEIFDYIKLKLSNFEQREYRFKKEDLELYNLVVKVKGKRSDKPLVFVGHMDTVDIGVGWDADPFEPIIRSDIIQGLGTSDTKSGLAAVISAVLSVEKPSQDVYLMFDADEEASGIGGKELSKNIDLKNANIIILEPTSSKVIIGQKGCLGFDIITKGTSSHSAFTSYENNLRNNAIYKANKIISRLMKYDRLISKNKSDTYGSPSFNIGYITGGKGGNSLAQECIMKIDRRLLPNENLDSVSKEITELILKVDSDAIIKTTFFGAPFSTSKDSRFVDKMLDLSSRYLNKKELGTISFWTEAALFSKFGNCLIFGVGKESQAHCTNESISINDYLNSVELFKELMR